MSLEFKCMSGMLHNIYNVVTDMQTELGDYRGLNFKVDQEQGVWIVRVKSNDRTKYAKIEFLINEEEESVVGSLLRYRGFARVEIENIMNGMIERF